MEQIANTLSESDINTCDNIYINYFALHTQISELYAVTKNYYEKVQAMKDAVFSSQQIYVDAAISGSVGKLTEGMQLLNESFISMVIAYFKSTYHINVEDYPKRETTSELLPSYSPIIEYIIQKVGTDFLKAGKDEVYKKFRNSFWRIRTQPIINGSLVKLPTYGKSLPRLTELLHALSVFVSGSVILTHDCKELLTEWKDQVSTDQVYPIDQLITIKLYANSRVDLRFQTSRHAEAFFSLYDLDIPPTEYVY